MVGAKVAARVEGKNRFGIIAGIIETKFRLATTSACVTPWCPSLMLLSGQSSIPPPRKEDRDGAEIDPGLRSAQDRAAGRGFHREGDR